MKKSLGENKIALGTAFGVVFGVVFGIILGAGIDNVGASIIPTVPPSFSRLRLGKWLRKLMWEHNAYTNNCTVLH